ncbi:MAG: hypothetical protein EA424_15760 [Planctomycetaceae bacterium]|nr:MAG: hypothetical protein EA424_15760 [Planctomycetaceae bacterium]
MGPVGEQPSEEHVWIPGSWLYQTNRYLWRPGHWSVGYGNRVWVPARYVWTPRGCIYVGGYWDYPLVYRGHLFAPVYFHRPIYRTAGFVYTPRVYVSASLLLNHFWVRPGYCHYYFGDYYGPRYVSWGIYPWFRFPTLHRRAYDPLYSYYRHRHWSSWHDHHHRWSSRYDWYTRHSNWRPPRTWNQQTNVQHNIVNIDARQYNQTDITNINSILLGRSLGEVADDRGGEERRMVRIDQQQRERYRQDSHRTRTIVEDRRRVEGGQPLDLADRRGTADRGRPGDTAVSSRGSLRLPISADPSRSIREGADGREGWTGRAGPSSEGPSGRSEPPASVRSPAQPRGDRVSGSGNPGHPAAGERGGERTSRETLRPPVSVADAPRATGKPRPDTPDLRGPTTDSRRKTAPDRGQPAREISEGSTPSGAPPTVRPDRSPERPPPSLEQPAPQSSPSVGRPSPQASRPAPSASRPAPSASRPAPSASRPAPSAGRPEPSRRATPAPSSGPGGGGRSARGGR